MGSVARAARRGVAFGGRLGAAVALALAAGGAGGSTIDTTTSDLGEIYRFGPPDTATYGQTLLGLSGPDTVLDGFSLFLRTQFDGTDPDPIQVKGYVATWDGAKASSILFESSAQTKNADSSLKEFAFATGGLPLALGGDYVFFLSISGLAQTSGNGFGMPFGMDTLDGAFVFLNNGNDVGELTSEPWEQSLPPGYEPDLSPNYQQGHDMFFKASFSEPVPLPAALTLSAAGVAGVAGLLRGRRRLPATPAA